MTFLFLLLNFVSIPYGNGVRGPRADGSMDSNVVSVATGFLASLCMASRLPGPKETLILILSATLVFATWPTIRHRIQFCGGKHARLVFTVGLGASGAASLLPFFLDDSIEPVYKRLLAAGVVLSTFLINFGIPLLFYRMQYAKHRINGPWDEAVVERQLIKGSLHKPFKCCVSARMELG
uniref:Uncharacterized protein n=1 Tax=Mesocestoides corti TaxID=53468 RepID=A0A5K3EKW6_MESCO